MSEYVGRIVPIARVAYGTYKHRYAILAGVVAVPVGVGAYYLYKYVKEPPPADGGARAGTVVIDKVETYEGGAYAYVYSTLKVDYVSSGMAEMEVYLNDKRVNVTWINLGSHTEMVDVSSLVPAVKHKLQYKGTGRLLNGDTNKFETIQKFNSNVYEFQIGVAPEPPKPMTVNIDKAESTLAEYVDVYSTVTVEGVLDGAVEFQIYVDDKMMEVFWVQIGTYKAVRHYTVLQPGSHKIQYKGTGKALDRTAGKNINVEKVDSNIVTFTVPEAPEPKPVGALTLTADKTEVTKGSYVNVSGTLTLDGKPASGYMIEIYRDGILYKTQFSRADGTYGPITVVGERVGSMAIQAYEAISGAQSDWVIVRVKEIEPLPPPPIPLLITSMNITDEYGNPMTPRKGYQSQVNMTIKNTSTATVTGIAILQVKDPVGTVEHLAYTSISLAAQATTKLGFAWTPQKSGTYKLQGYCWISWTDPTPLSEIYTLTVTVT